MKTIISYVFLCFISINTVLANAKDEKGNLPAEDEITLFDKTAGKALQGYRNNDFSDTITIMLVGNSITEENPGFKSFLWDSLIVIGYNVAFAGPKTDPGTKYLKHAGFGGYSIGPDSNLFLDAIDPWGHGNILFHLDEGYKLINYDADAWLLLIGTNDFWNQNTYDPASVGADRLENLVNNIFARDPDLILFLATILPTRDDSNHASLFNAEVPAIIEKYKNMGFSIHLVDMNQQAGLISTDYNDNVHPNSEGYKKIADVWFKSFDANINTTPEPATRKPYNSQTFKIPGKIQTEYYDFGGAGLAYADSTRGNNGNSILRLDDVDIAMADSTNNHAIMEFEEGEWLTYSVNIENGIYDISVNASSNNSNSKLEIRLFDSLNEVLCDTLAIVDITNTSDPAKFKVHYIADREVTHGGENKILKIFALGGSFSLDWISISKARTSQLLDNTAGSLSEGVPYGVPSNWNWVSAATEATLDKSDNYTHTNYWGAIFRDLSNTTPSNSVVQVSNCTYYILYEDSTEWTLIQDNLEALGGATFTPAYHGTSIEPFELGHTNEGMFVVPAIGNIYHFWYGPGYEPFLFNKVKAVLVNMNARLVLSDPEGADDRDDAGYLIHVGCDWRDPNDPSCSQTSNVCPSFGVGKLDTITSNWRNHTFHSLSEEEIRNGLFPLPPDSIFQLPDNTPPAVWDLTGSLLTGEEELLYEEEFKENSLNGWVPVVGTWRVKNEQLENPTYNGGDELAYYSQAKFKKFILTVDGIPSWNNDYGIIYNYRDSANFYFLTIDPEPQIARIQIKRSGIIDTIAENGYPLAGSSNIELQHDGINTSAFINGQQVFKNVNSVELTEGYIGAYSWWCPMKFDNFKVYAIPGSDSSFIPVSISNIDANFNGVCIYPNPTDSRSIYLAAGELIKDAVVNVYSINGEQLSSSHLDIHKNTPLRLRQELEGGIYFIEIKSSNRSIMLKLILL